MKIIVLTIGTRGDLEIMLAIGLALHARGHRVVIATSPFYGQRVAEVGMLWRAIGDGTLGDLQSLIGRLAPVHDKHDRLELYARDWLRPQLAAGREALRSELASADYFVNNLRLWEPRVDGRSIPTALIGYDPVSDPARLLASVAESSGRGDVLLEIVAIHRQLVDPHQKWPAEFQFVGFVAPPMTATNDIPTNVRRFVSDRNPPVVLTMGSMASFDASQLRQIVLAACRDLGKRLVVILSWSQDSAASADDLLCTNEVPYDWLFERAACVIHHGGCGTVSSVLRAGKPSILLPQIPSQQYFGELLVEQQLASASIDPDLFTVDSFTAAIERALHDHGIAAAVSRWRDAIGQDDGATMATELIEGHFARQGASGR